jgi:hypothetical protein
MLEKDRHGNFKVLFSHLPQVTKKNHKTPDSRKQISQLGPKTNLADAHQDKMPTTQLKSMTNVMALRTKIQTFSRKQDFNIQMHTKANLDVWNSTMGMC